MKEMMKWFLIIFILFIIYIKRQNLDLSYEYFSRANLFDRFKYMPSTTPMAPANHVKNRVIIQGRSYLPNEEKNSWYYPWYYPEKSNLDCFDEAQERCNEKLDLSQDTIHTTKCFNYVFDQCINGVPPIKIQTIDV